MDMKDAVIKDVSAQITDSEKLKLTESDVDANMIQSQLSSQEVQLLFCIA